METATAHISRRCRPIIASAVIASALLASVAAHTPAASGTPSVGAQFTQLKPADAPKKARAYRWLRHSRVPVAPGLRFHLGGIDYGGLVGVTSGYDVGANMIRWSGTLKTVGDRLDLYHEAGHGFDHQLMTPLDRERVRRLIDPSNDHPWFWPEGSDPGNKAWQPFEERFADVYARLAAGSKGYPELRGFLQMIAARSGR